MNLLQKAAETYDNLKHLTAVEIEGQVPLAPVGHNTTRSDIEITLTLDGKQVDVREYKSIVCIPVTEKSMSRTANNAPHALADQLCYLTNLNEDKHKAYMTALQAWVDNSKNKKLAAVYTYLAAETLLDDLNNAGLAYTDKTLVTWAIKLEDGSTIQLWKDKDIINSHIEQTRHILSQTTTPIMCMISGEMQYPMTLHMKGVVRTAANAKIISSGDKFGFTYRGLINNAGEALSIGFETSSKAHNVLKWLVSNQGFRIKDRTYVCWNPNGLAVPSFAKALIDTIDGNEKNGDNTSTKVYTPDEYKTAIESMTLKQKGNYGTNEEIIVAALEACTDGRLSIVYYNELHGSDFIDRLAQWDISCCWTDRFGTHAPSLYQMALFADANIISGTATADDRMLTKQLQKLISSRLENHSFPLDIKAALVRKTSNLILYNKTDKQRLLFVTCAAIRKSLYDHGKGELDMVLEEHKKDRSYQFGRLLAVMEKIERDTFTQEEKDKRETSAMKQQQMFIQRPGTTAQRILLHLKTSYFRKHSIGLQNYFERLIGEIMEECMSADPEHYNAPLTEMYIPGYYLQRNAFYQKKDKNKEENEEEI